MEIFRQGEQVIAAHAPAAINYLRKLDHDMPPRHPDRIRLFTASIDGRDGSEVSDMLRAQQGAGRTGLHLALDLPTLCGIDSDHPLARHEVGHGGMPICHIGDMRAAFDGVPLDQIDLSIEAGGASPWLLALLVALADERGVEPTDLRGISIGDVFTESLVGQTGICAPEPCLQMQADMMAWADRRLPQWSPTSLSAMPLTKGDATPEEDVGRAITSAIALFDSLRDRVKPENFTSLLGRAGFTVPLATDPRQTIDAINAISEQWSEIRQERYELTGGKRIPLPFDLLIETFPSGRWPDAADVDDLLLQPIRPALSGNAYLRSARFSAHAGKLGSNKAAGNINAKNQTDLEYQNTSEARDSTFEKPATLISAAAKYVDRNAATGGPSKALATMRAELSGKPFRSTIGPPQAYPDAEDQLARLAAWREKRNGNAAQKTLLALREAAKRGIPLMGPSVACAKAGVTTGEWAAVIRNILGGIESEVPVLPAATVSESLARAVTAASAQLGRPPSVLIGRPGLTVACGSLDRLASLAKSSGIEVHHAGARLTPHDILSAALKDRVHLICLPIQSTGQLPLLSDIRETLKTGGLGHIPIIVIESFDGEKSIDLAKLGVALSYKADDFNPKLALRDMVSLIDRQKTT